MPARGLPAAGLGSGDCGAAASSWVTAEARGGGPRSVPPRPAGGHREVWHRDASASEVAGESRMPSSLALQTAGESAGIVQELRFKEGNEILEFFKAKKRREKNRFIVLLGC